jgi:hypothetical protein
MARISKHGPVVARLVKVEDGQRDIFDRCNWRRTTLSFHEDGTVLHKHDVRFVPSEAIDGERVPAPHSYGWKVGVGFDPKDLALVIKSHLKSGYTYEEI